MEGKRGDRDKREKMDIIWGKEWWWGGGRG